MGELPVAFEIDITLNLSGQGNDESDLRPGADDLRLEAAHAVAGAGVATDLLVDIPYGTDKKLVSLGIATRPNRNACRRRSDTASIGW